MGTNEMDIRAGFESAGTLLKCPPRYESDIAKLRSCSRDTLRYLAHHSQIGVAGVPIRVSRDVVGVLLIGNRAGLDCSRWHAWRR